MSTHLIARIEQLETHQAFQEALIESLNQTVIALQKEALQLKAQLQLLTARTQSVHSSLLAPQEEETPPPHY